MPSFHHAILVDKIREQADWRSLKSEEYPDDSRNESSADALTSLADYIGALEVLPPTLAQILNFENTDVFPGGEEATSDGAYMYISRWNKDACNHENQ